jgi:hypothetical protein
MDDLVDARRIDDNPVDPLLWAHPDLFTLMER